LAAMQVRMGLNLIGLYARLSSPFIPDTSGKLHTALALDALDWPEDVAGCLSSLTPGHTFVVPDNLFAKISDEDREDWQEKFAGTRS